MRNYRKQDREDAVSPVVGVMLMLVVTIIIAAIVSAFAGGMSDSQKTSPSLVLKGTYSQSDGMTIVHAGGDPIALTELEFRTVPSELFGSDSDKFAYLINKTVIRDMTGGQITNESSGFFYKTAFVAGDVLTINQTDCNDYATNDMLVGTDKDHPVYLGWINRNAQNNWGEVVTTDPSDKSVYFRAYQFSNPANIGKYFYLDLLDPAGNIITRAKIDITG